MSQICEINCTSFQLNEIIQMKTGSFRPCSNQKRIAVKQKIGKTLRYLRTAKNGCPKLFESLGCEKDPQSQEVSIIGLI